MIIQSTIKKVKYTINIVGADNYSVNPPAKDETIREIIKSLVWKK